jgi:hypothetical protein
MPELAFATKINPSPRKPGKAGENEIACICFLLFGDVTLYKVVKCNVAFYFLESRLFKGLLPIQIIKKVRRPPGRRAVTHGAVSLRSMGISITSISDFCKKKAWLSRPSPNINQATPPGRRPGATTKATSCPRATGRSRSTFASRLGRPSRPSRLRTVAEGREYEVKKQLPVWAHLCYWHRRRTS